MKETEYSETLIRFCQYSLTSADTAIVTLSSQVLNNHLCQFKGDLKHITPHVREFQLELLKLLPKITDRDTLYTVLVVECRIIYKNRTILDQILYEDEAQKKQFVDVHTAVRVNTEDIQILEVLEDLFSLIGQE